MSAPDAEWDSLAVLKFRQQVAAATKSGSQTGAKGGA